MNFMQTSDCVQGKQKSRNSNHNYCYLFRNASPFSFLQTANNIKSMEGGYILWISTCALAIIIVMSWLSIQLMDILHSLISTSILIDACFLVKCKVINPFVWKILFETLFSINIVGFIMTVSCFAIYILLSNILSPENQCLNKFNNFEACESLTNYNLLKILINLYKTSSIYKKNFLNQS